MSDKIKHSKINDILACGIAENTAASIISDTKYFWGWAKLTMGRTERYPIPNEVVEKFITDHVDHIDRKVDAILVSGGIKRPGQPKVSTVARRVKSISWMHARLGYESPYSKKIRKLLINAKRSEANSGIVIRRSLAITKPILLRMIESIDTSKLVGKRDRAILEFGFFTGGRRRSEIAGAEMRFLNRYPHGYTYLLHRSKTDQLSKGSLKILRSPYSKSLTSWIESAGIEDGFIFRKVSRSGQVSEKSVSGWDVNAIVKRYIEAIKEDPKRYSAHGLRRGFMTQCGRTGTISLGDAMALGGWSDVRTAMMYYEEGNVFENPATRL